MSSRIEALLTATRARIRRVSAREAHAIQQSGGLVVDTRPVAWRKKNGAIPGALIIERNVLEWRLDPSSPDRLPQVTGHDQPIVVLCNEGYASSLAVASLMELGLRAAADLEGGFAAWKAAGLPVVDSDE